ncbi:phosphate transport system permease protein PstA [Nitrospira sp.]|nr:phosphate transport system permease protein PstA [Nitrospira sp.]
MASLRTTQSGHLMRRKLAEQLFVIFGLGTLLLAIAVLVLLFGQLAVDGLPRLRWEFFTSFPSRRAGEAGILSAWVGTCLIMLVTIATGIPIGVAAGVYLEEYAPKNWMTDLIEVTVTNLAGVPSIIYGLLALGAFVYFFGLGDTILTAGLTLALLILPVVIVATREAIRAVPVQIREGAYGVGATKWQIVTHHVLPYSLAGILTGVIIGLSRAIGETAPIITIGALTFIAFLPPAPLSPTPPFVSFEWLNSAFTALPIQMFSWVSRPGEAFLSNAAAAGMVLMVMTLLMNGAAIYVRYRMRKRITW